jgi:DNA-binding XRE family transcriptional regulator
MLSKNLKKYRTKNKISKTELARRTKLSKRTIEFIEVGKQDNPTLKTIKALAKELGISIEELVK